MAPILDVAKTYIRREWSPIPIPHGEKAPRHRGWQQLRITTDNAPEFFNGQPQNIGVLLGAPSGWLVDVDLDHRLAVKRADKYLPPTPAVFGRDGKPRSHRLYRVTGPLETKKFRTEAGESIVEVRATGCHTVFPPSLHPSGERIRWDDKNAEPAEVSPDELLEAVSRLAKAVKKTLGEKSSPAKRVAARATGEEFERFNLIDRAQAYLKKLPPAVSGKRGHDRAYNAACVLRCDFGLSFDEALAAIRHWNLTCDPPWSDDELHHKLNEAGKQPATLRLAKPDKPTNAGRPRVGAKADSKVAGNYRCTDLGNAERLRDRYGKNLRYCHVWDKWLVWDGMRWAQDQTGAVSMLCKSTVREMYGELSGIDDDDKRKKFVQFIVKSESAPRLNAMATATKLCLALNLELTNRN